jgi:hypothetical protein
MSIPRTKDEGRLQPMDIQALRKLHIPERQMILDPAIPEKGTVMLYAGRGTGKTYAAIGISVAVATATRFLKWHAPQPRKVLHCDGEMAAGELRERLVQAITACGVEPQPRMLNVLSADIIEFGIGNMASPEIQQELEPWLDASSFSSSTICRALPRLSGTMTRKAGTRCKSGCFAFVGAASQC